MARYTEQLLFGPYPAKAGDAHIIIQANGGACAINAVMSNGDEVPIPDSPFTADAVFSLNVANGHFRVTPTGAAAYEWSDG